MKATRRLAALLSAFGLTAKGQPKPVVAVNKARRKAAKKAARRARRVNRLKAA